MIDDIITPAYPLLVVRKIRKSVKMSVYRDFIQYLKDIEVYNEIDHNKSDLEYTAPNGNYVVFTGLDDREKIKSTQWGDIWVEEASDISKEDFIFLKTRLYRGKLNNHIPKIFLSYNPIECWLSDYKSPDITTIHSTVDDNPFANKEYIDTLNALQQEDEAYYKIYRLGIEGQHGTIIYKPYTILDRSQVIILKYRLK